MHSLPGVNLAHIQETSAWGFKGTSQLAKLTEYGGKGEIPKKRETADPSLYRAAGVTCFISISTKAPQGWNTRRFPQYASRGSVGFSLLLRINKNLNTVRRNRDPLVSLSHHRAGGLAGVWGAAIPPTAPQRVRRVRGAWVPSERSDI